MSRVRVRAYAGKLLFCDTHGAFASAVVGPRIVRGVRIVVVARCSRKRSTTRDAEAVRSFRIRAVAQRWHGKAVVADRPYRVGCKKRRVEFQAAKARIWIITDQAVRDAQPNVQTETEHTIGGELTDQDLVARCWAMQRVQYPQS